MDTTILIGILAGLSGGFLTGLLTSVVAPRLDSWFKFRAHRRKVLNRAAFELHVLLNSISDHLEPASSKAVIRSHSLKVLKGKYTKNEINEVVDYMFSGLEDPSRLIVPPNLELKLKERIEAIIDPIVEVDPILAFRIKKRHGQKLDTPVPKTLENKIADKDKEFEFDRIKDRILAKYRLRAIRSDLRLITFSISPMTFLGSISVTSLERVEQAEYYQEVYSATFEDHFQEPLEALLNIKRREGTFPPHPKVKSFQPGSPTPSQAD